MQTRYKFLLLLFLSFCTTTSALLLFLRSDYARRERAYFHHYPYQELAARKANEARQKMMAQVAPDLLRESDSSLSDFPFFIDQAEAFALPKKKTKTDPVPKPPKKPQRAKTKPAPSPPPPPQKTKIIKTAPKPPSPPATDPASLGYAAYNRGAYDQAIAHFQKALNIKDRPEIHEQLAYAYKKVGQYEQAIHHFKRRIQSYGTEKAPFGLRREVEQLSDRFALDGYSIYRGESIQGSRLTGADLTQSQFGLDLRYQTGKIQFYGRFLSGMRRNQLALNPDSYQAGLGVRLKAWPDHNLIFSLERLIRVGRFSRSDWMLRAGYSRDYGTDYRDDRTGWWQYSLYLDAALIRPARPDILLTLQGTGGYALRVGDGLVLHPHFMTLVNWQKDSFHRSSLIEGGPGLTFRTYFNDSPYEAWRSRLDITLSYRVKLAGNSINSHSGPVIGLLFHF